MAACTRNAPNISSSDISVSIAPTRTPFQPVILTATPTISPTPVPPTATASLTPSPYSLWIAPEVADLMGNRIHLPHLWGITENVTSAALQLRVGEDNPISQWVFALVAPFPTIDDDISGQDLHRAWKGGETDSVWRGVPLLMAESTLEAISAYWGEPAPESVRVIPKAELLDHAWEEGIAWAIIPFEELSPRWKVISIDGISPLHKVFDAGDYELIIPISLIGGNPPEGFVIPSTNRHADKLTTLVMTGVTALVRATAYTMEIRSVTYPGEDIGDWLREADIAHISNEVPFAKDCPFPNPVQEGMRFCSADRYLELLEYIGTDIIELTGDHFSDWGAQAMLHTLELYDERGWPVYGGGEMENCNSINHKILH